MYLGQYEDEVVMAMAKSCLGNNLSANEKAKLQAFVDFKQNEDKLKKVFDEENNEPSKESASETDAMEASEE